MATTVARGHSHDGPISNFVHTMSDYLTANYYAFIKKCTMCYLTRPTAFVLSKIYTASVEVIIRQSRASKWHRLITKSTICLCLLTTCCISMCKDEINTSCIVNFIRNCYSIRSPISLGRKILNGKCRLVHYTIALKTVT